MGAHRHPHVRRAKNGNPSTHPLRGDEIRLTRTSPAVPGLRLCFRDRARRPVHARRSEPANKAHRCARRLPLPGARSHVAARLRLRSCQCWARHAADSGPAGPLFDTTHRQVQRTQLRTIRPILAQQLGAGSDGPALPDAGHRSLVSHFDCGVALEEGSAFWRGPS
jgi:hypothetical protein